MDEAELRAGFKELEELATSEYRRPLSEIIAEPDRDLAAKQVGRLMGVILKEPFATSQDLPEPSIRTCAYRAWELMEPTRFQQAAAAAPWQYTALEMIRDELVPEEPYLAGPVYNLANYAQFESGFFGLFARSLRKYICGDKELRRRIDQAVKSATGGNMTSAPTPEVVVGAGGMSLGVYLVQAVPALGIVGATGIAALVVVLYVIGVDAFCEWAVDARTDQDEKH